MHDWLFFVKFYVSLFSSFVMAGGVLSPESHDLSHDEGFDSEDDSDHYEDFSSDAGWFTFVHLFTRVFHLQLSHNVPPKWQIVEADRDRSLSSWRNKGWKILVLFLYAWMQV